MNKLLKFSDERLKLIIYSMSISIILVTAVSLLQSCQGDEFFEGDNMMVKNSEIEIMTIPDAGDVWWGPVTVYPSKAGFTETVTLDPPANSEVCFELWVQNGDDAGINKVTGATVTINGVEIVGSADLRKAPAVIYKEVCEIVPPFIISAQAKGKPTNSLTIWIVWKTVPPINDDLFTDLAGKTYDVVTIGELTWMAENLAYLPSVNQLSESSRTVPRYYVYGYNGNSIAEAKNLNNYKTYGALYNKPAAVASCPEGWRLPSTADWEYLLYVLGSDPGLKMKSTTDDWQDDGKGTNSSGFNGLPAGGVTSAQTFQDLGFKGMFWSEDGFEWEGVPWSYFGMLYAYSNNLSITSHNFSSIGLSIRYVKGNLPDVPVD